MMKFLRLFLSLVLSSLIGCSSSDYVKLEKEISGYKLSIEAIPGGIGKTKCSRLVNDAADVFKQRIEVTTGAESIIGKLNAERGPIQVPETIYDLLVKVIDAQQKSDGYWNPFLGEVRKLWGIDESTPRFPSPDSVEQAQYRASNTRLILLDEKKVELEGSGSLFLGRAALGWALDEASKVMSDGGIEAGLLSAGGAYRHWGMRSPDAKWGVIISALPIDSAEYVIESDEGGLCEINLREFNTDERIIAEVIYPFDGEPREGMVNLTLWAPNAMQACLFAETMYAMDRSDILHWSDVLEGVGVFFIRQENIGVIGEANSRMSLWVSKL